MFERSIIVPRRKTRAIFHFNHTHKRHKHRELISKSTKFEIESHARRVSRAIGIKHQVKILLRVEEQRQRHSSTRARAHRKNRNSRQAHVTLEIARYANPRVNLLRSLREILPPSRGQLPSAKLTKS